MKVLIIMLTLALSGCAGFSNCGAPGHFGSCFN